MLRNWEYCDSEQLAVRVGIVVGCSIATCLLIAAIGRLGYKRWHARKYAVSQITPENRADAVEPVERSERFPLATGARDRVVPSATGAAATSAAAK